MVISIGKQLKAHCSSVVPWKKTISGENCNLNPSQHSEQSVQKRIIVKLNELQSLRGKSVHWHSGQKSPQNDGHCTSSNYPSFSDKNPTVFQLNYQGVGFENRSRLLSNGSGSGSSCRKLDRQDFIQFPKCTNHMFHCSIKNIANETCLFVRIINHFSEKI